MATTKVPILREVTKTRQGDKIQANAALAAKALNNFALQPGVLVKGVSLTTGVTNQIIHGLGRTPAGWFMSRPRSVVSGTPATSESTLDKNTLGVGAYGVFTADFWIF